MSEQSFAEIDAPQQPSGATLHTPFETECFDADAVFKRYGINPAVHSWAEVSKDENLYKKLTAYLGKHGLQQRSFSPMVVVKEIDEAEELLKDEDPSKLISLQSGLGLIHLTHTLDDGRTVAIKALHQRRGPIVGGRCGAETWENIVVFAEGPDGRDTLQSFLEYVVNSECRRTRPNMYTIYRWQVEHGYWKRLASKTSRSIESVVLPDETKEKIISDIDSFISRETFQFYTNHGIPYKRSYLFYGVPGAGKTSLLTAIAGKYRRDLYIVQPTDPRFTDDSLAEAIKDAPSRSIIVLEDVDALFDKNREAKNSKMTISFSGLLNALDGIGNPDGQIFVLTTNFRENLDSALIRNGRVDMHLEFSYATTEQMEKLFCQFYPSPTDLPLAATFRESVHKVLGGKPVNMAAMQHFFTRNMRKSAHEAIAGVQSIVDDLNEKAVANTAPSPSGPEKESAGGKDSTDDATNSSTVKQPNPTSSGVHMHNTGCNVHVYNSLHPTPVRKEALPAAQAAQA
jgi:mitochondrial chaperone BCS1